MDIATSSRPFFASSTGEKISLSASNTVYTYHCLCSHLLLATTTPLPALPRRKNSQDKAHIMPLPPAPAPIDTARRSSQPTPMDHYGLLISTRLDRNPEIITSEEGYEKRYLQRCGRCNLAMGYQLDWQQFTSDKMGRREDCVFLLPGGLVKTADMIVSKSAAEANTVGSGGGIEPAGVAVKA